MKKIILLSFIIFLNNINAQNMPSQGVIIPDVKIFHITNNVDVGFGKNDVCDKHLNIVVNGPLLGIDGKLVGGYIDNGVQEKDWIIPDFIGGNFSIDNGIFGVTKDGKPFLYEYSEYTKRYGGSPLFNGKILWAFQNGLILVKKGKNIRGTSRSRYQRSGIGYDKDGKILIIISLKPITLNKFAELFVKEDCVSAIYLGGGPYVGFSSMSLKYRLIKNATKLQFFHQI